MPVLRGGHLLREGCRSHTTHSAQELNPRGSGQALNHQELVLLEAGWFPDRLAPSGKGFHALFLVLEWFVFFIIELS